jgi:hypothetical protein
MVAIKHVYSYTMTLLEILFFYVTMSILYGCFAACAVAAVRHWVKQRRHLAAAANMHNNDEAPAIVAAVSVVVNGGAGIMPLAVVEHRNDQVQPQLPPLPLVEVSAADEGRRTVAENSMLEIR